jgi:hypothetical protein
MSIEMEAAITIEDVTDSIARQEIGDRKIGPEAEWCEEEP